MFECAALTAKRACELSKRVTFVAGVSCPAESGRLPISSERDSL